MAKMSQPSPLHQLERVATPASTRATLLVPSISHTAWRLEKLSERETFVSHMGTIRVVPLLNIHLEHQRWECTPSSHLGHKLRGVLRQCGSEAFGDSDPELWFAECCPVLTCCSTVCCSFPALSPTVTHSADVAKHSLCHCACRKPSTTVPMMSPVSLPSFISTAMCPQGGCVSRHLCTSSSLMVQDITLDFNPLEPFEFVHSLLKLVCEAKIH